MATDNVTQILTEIARRLTDNTRRIRIMEERLRNLDSRANALEKNVLEFSKQANATLQEHGRDVDGLHDRLANMEVDVQTLKKDTKKVVTKNDLKEITNYIELINPITTKYVTKKEAKEMLAELKERL